MVEDQNSVEEEVTPLDQEPMVAEHSEETPEDSQGQEESKEERNWRELRKKAEAAERRASEAEEKAKMQDEMLRNFMMQSQTPQRAAAPEPEIDEFADIDPDDYPTWKLADKRIEKRASEIAERKYRELEAKREQERFVERLKSRYPDFEEVVNSEAIKLFEKQEPELAQTIAELKDPYKMGLQTYHLLKKANSSEAKDEQRNAKEVEKNLDKNRKSVQSPQAYEKRPMAKAFDIANMSQKEKDSLYAEMTGYARMSPGF